MSQTMTKADEAVQAILQRYREWRMADMPADWVGAKEFGALWNFHTSDSHVAFHRAVPAVFTLFRILKQPKPSMRSVERILGALSEKATS